MVALRVIVRAVLLAVVAVSAQKEDNTQSEQTCIAPTVVSSLEAKIQGLEASNAKWATQLETATAEKAALQKELTEVRVQYRTAEQAQREAIAKTTELDKKIAASEQKHKHAVSDVHKQVSTLEQSVQELTTQLTTEKKATTKQTAALETAQKKVQQYVDKIKGLERDLVAARKNNEALRVELGKLDEKLTFSALLSSYYDEGVILTTHAVETLTARTEESVKQLTEAVAAVDLAKLSAYKTTEKLYAEHLASTLDPLVADVHRVLDPHIATYRPLLEAQVKRTKKIALQWYKIALKRANRARAEATRLLQQHAAVAPYAAIVVDSALALLAIPLVIVVVRVLSNTLWWLLTTTVCVLSCGCCCGAKKRTKLKRKMSRKQIATPTTTNTTSGSKKTMSTPTSTNVAEKRRGSGKKK